MAEYAGVLVFRGDAVLRVKERYAAWDRACWNFTATVDQEDLSPDDPDGLVDEAAWFSVAQAAGLLAELPSPQLRVPALDHLATRRTGVRWEVDDHGVHER